MKNESQINNNNKPRILRKFLKFTLYLLFLIIVFISLVLFSITTDIGTSYLIETAKSKKELFLKDNYGFEIGEIRTNLFSRLIIKDVSLFSVNKEGDKDTSIIYIGTIEANYSLYDILFDSKFESFTIDGIVTDIKQDSLGLNVVKALKLDSENKVDKEVEIETKENENRSLFIIEKVKIINSFINYNDKVNNITISSNLSLDLNYNYSKKSYLFNMKYNIPEIIGENKFIANNSSFIIEAVINLEEILVKKLDFISDDLGIVLKTSSAINFDKDLLDFSTNLTINTLKLNRLLEPFLSVEMKDLISLAGIIKLDINAKNSKIKEPKINISVTSDELSLFTEQYDIDNKLSLKELQILAKIDDENLELEKLGFDILEGEINLSGKYNINETKFETDNHISNINLETIAKVFANFQKLQDKNEIEKHNKLPLSGLLNIILNSSGDIGDIFNDNMSNLKITFDKLVFDKFNLDTVGISLAIKNNNIDLLIKNNERLKITSNSIVDINKDNIKKSLVNGAISFDTIDIKRYDDILENFNIKNILGKVGFNSNYSISDTLVSLDSKIRVDKLSAFNFDMDSVKIGSSVKYEKIDEISNKIINDLIIELPNTTIIKIAGDLLLRNDKDGNPKNLVKQKININNVFLKDYIAELDSNIEKISGELNTEIHVNGNMISPSISISNFKFTDFSLKHKQIPLDIENGYISVSSDSNLISIDSCIFKFENDGIFSTNGNIDFDYYKVKLNDIDLNLFANNIKLEEENLFRFKLDLLKFNIFKQSTDKYYVSGDIKLGNTAFTKHLELSELLAGSVNSSEESKRSFKTAEKLQFKVKNSVKELLENEETNIIDMFKLDINIKESDSLFIDNNIANIRMHSELNVVGKVSNPGVIGKFSIDEGILNYLDNEFRIEKGDVFFNAVSRIDPELDILAKAEIIDNNDELYIISLTMTGPINQLVIELTSDPLLEKADIVSLIVFGMISGDLDGSKFAKDQAGRAATGSLSKILNSNVSNAIGVDAINIEGNLFDPSNKDTKIATTKKLTKKITATYKSSLVDINDYKVIINYKLNKLFSIEGETNNKDDSGIDFIFEKEIE